MSKTRRTAAQGRNLPTRNGGQITEVAVRSEYYEGVLPDPETLAKYEAISPGLIEWMKARVDHQAEHRTEMERHYVFTATKRATLGQWFAFILGIGTLVVAGFGFANKQPLEGLGAVVVGIGSIAGAYIYGRTQDRKEREEKDKALHAGNKLNP